MRLARLDTRKAEIVVGLILMALAALVIRETLRLGAGWGPLCAGRHRGEMFSRRSAIRSPTHQRETRR